MNLIEVLAKELNLRPSQVEKTVELLDEGNTIPFISRYRKEVTGGLDDVTLRTLDDRLHYLRKLDERRAEITKLIDEQGKLTPELSHAISLASTLVELEDIYLPYRPKRKTRASVARDKGLEPLAAYIMAQNEAYEPTIEAYAEEFIDEEKGVDSKEAALAGACDILAEDVANDANLRKSLRALLTRRGELRTQSTDLEGEKKSVYADYAEYHETVSRVPSHRVLAVNRGEKEGYLKVSIELPEAEALAEICAQTVTNKDSAALTYLMPTLTDSYRRLLFPSLERELRTALFDAAGEKAIVVFADNLRHLLMGAPLKGKTVMGYDPGFRTGCKLAVVDATGKVLATAVIYPTEPKKDIAGASRTVSRLVSTYDVDVIAIGNGTASRESERFIADLLPSLSRSVAYTIVSESGASVYSASKLAQEEFPDFDVTERSAVSIARRLQDPLAELVKIEPKAVGVGQYQHDVTPKKLDEALHAVVEDCVNGVGVELNTASSALLQYVAGLSRATADGIVKLRNEQGKLTSRKQLLKVPRLGPKAYEQCAGFIRIADGDDPLDNTPVHPESYQAAEALLGRLGYNKCDLRTEKLAQIRDALQQVSVKDMAKELEIGEPTLKDIVAALQKPGRDPREELDPPLLRSDVLSMEDLKPGMELKGTVRNVVDFGAFVDIGVKQDGLIHISQFGAKFIKHPMEVVAVGDIITVRVLDVDLRRGRIALTMRKDDIQTEGAKNQHQAKKTGDKRK